MDSFLDSINENNSKSDFNAVLSSRNFMLDWIGSLKRKFLKQIQELIEQIKTLENSENKNNNSKKKAQQCITSIMADSTLSEPFGIAKSSEQNEN